MKKRVNRIFIENKKNLILIIMLLLLISLLLKSFDFTIFLFLFFILCIFYKIKNYNIIKKIVDSIREEELQLIEKEIKRPIFEKKYNFLMTNNYIIKQYFDIALIKYSDIILIYKKIGFNFHTFNSVFIIVDNQKRKYKFLLRSSKIPNLENGQYFEEIIKEKNPNVLVGYNKKNIDKIKELYDFRINK